ncbi:MAG: cytochrome c peroxidase [Caldilineaceae bacterium]
MNKTSSVTGKPSTGKQVRTTAKLLIFALEIVCVLLLLYSLRYLFQSSWASRKLTSLQAEAAIAAQTPTGDTVAANVQNSTAPTATVEVVAAAATEAPTATAAPVATEPEAPTAMPKADVAKTDENGLSAEANLALATLFHALPDEMATDPKHPVSPELVKLGRMLFYETRISNNDSFSCNTCHNLATYGVDGLALSLGVTGEPVARNSPSVYNAALHIAQFWDGRSPDVEDQATKPIMAAGEMGMIDAEKVKAKVESIKGYRELFAAAFPGQADPINLTNIGIAIGAFERGLLTPSRFDKLLAGDTSQFTEQEIRGLNTFVSLRCITCHTGTTVGGTLYKKLGAVEAYTTQDLGRYTVTKSSDDKYVFKVPSLRNVTKTGPYMHDGSITNLDEMVRLMARYQLGKKVSDDQVKDIIAFLGTLTGDLPSDYIAKPELP